MVEILLTILFSIIVIYILAAGIFFIKTYVSIYKTRKHLDAKNNRFDEDEHIPRR